MHNWAYPRHCRAPEINGKWYRRSEREENQSRSLKSQEEQKYNVFEMLGELAGNLKLNSQLNYYSKKKNKMKMFSEERKCEFTTNRGGCTSPKIFPKDYIDGTRPQNEGFLDQRSRNGGLPSKSSL